MILKQIKQSIYWLPSICLVTFINHEKNTLHLSGDANEQAVHTSLRKQYSCCAITFFHPMGAPFPYPLRPGERRTGASKRRITPHLKKSLHCSSLLFGCEIWRPFWQQWGQTTSTQSLNCLICYIGSEGSNIPYQRKAMSKVLAQNYSERNHRPSYKVWKIYL